jgi:hypothetical protein
MNRAAVAFRAHSGWAGMVVLEGSLKAPRVLQRRRLELADRAVEGSCQLYHTAGKMSWADAQAFIEERTETSTHMAEGAIRKLIAELGAKGFRLSGACVLQASGRALPGLQSILASHPLIHTAEGEFFRRVLRDGCVVCGVSVCGIREKELVGIAAARLRLSESEVEGGAAEFGKLIGPPWGQDEKLCAIAAWVVLAGDNEACPPSWPQSLRRKRSISTNQ